MIGNIIVVVMIVFHVLLSFKMGIGPSISRKEKRKKQNENCEGGGEYNINKPCSIFFFV